MPVHKSTVWIVLPCPNVQGVKGGKLKAVWRLEVVKQLSHQLWRTGVGRIPGIGKNQEIGANQAEPSSRNRFVNHDCWTRGINDAIGENLSVNEVKPHRPRIGPAYATELKSISFRFSPFYVLKALSGVADDTY